jgi:hypothetical protein
MPLSKWDPPFRGAQNWDTRLNDFLFQIKDYADSLDYLMKSFVTMNILNQTIDETKTYVNQQIDGSASDVLSQMNEKITQLVKEINTTIIEKTGDSSTTVVEDIKGGVPEEGDSLAKLYAMIKALQEITSSDDLNLDTLQEIVNYIKDNQGELGQMGSGKVDSADIVNHLNTASTITGRVLDARQGKVLKDLITALGAAVDLKIEEAKNEAVETAGSNTTNSTTNILNESNHYTDQKITNVLNEAEEIAKDLDADVLAAAKRYADLGDESTLDKAKEYADNQRNAAISDSKEYTDDITDGLLTDAKTYADSKAADALQSAINHSDSNDSATLSSAKSYTNSEITKVLASAKTYTDNVTNTMYGDITYEYKQHVKDTIKGLEPAFDILPITKGGTNANNATSARANLGIQDVTGSIGQVYYLKETGSREVVPDYIFQVGKFVNNTADLNSERNRPTSFKNIFDTWTRFNVGVNKVDGEEASWEYLQATDQVRCLVNSGGHIGFVSLDKFENYQHEMVASSVDGDNDMIGIVIAAARDSSNRLHTLTAVRVSALLAEGHVLSQGDTTSWSICYNFMETDAKLIANGASKLTNSGQGGWSTYPTGVKMKVIREKNIIKATTSQMNSLTLDNNTLLTVDLNSDPVLAKFLGPSMYGYSCCSQAKTVFSNIIFSDVSSSIVDLSTSRIYVYRNGAWAQDGTLNIRNMIKPGQILANSFLKKLYFVRNYGDIIEVQM